MKIQKLLAAGLALLLCATVAATPAAFAATPEPTTAPAPAENEEPVAQTDVQGAPAADTAADPADNEDAETPDSAALTQAVLATDPATAALPNSTLPAVPDTPYTKVFSFSENQLFSGVYKTYSFFFNVEDYWDTAYAYAQIEFSVSPLIEDVPASLTFSLNNTPVSSVKVDYRNGKTQAAYVELPVALLKPGFNSLSLSGYVRLYDEEGCLDDFSGANWVDVSKESSVQVGYDVIDTADALCYYPYPFMSSTDETGAACAVYLPADATEEELQAALLLRADLGNETDDEDNIALKTLDAYATAPAANRVVAALRQNLPADLAALLPANQALTDRALVAESSDEKGSVLIVTADNGQALYEGVAMLLDENRVTQEFGSTATVPMGAATTAIENSTLSDLTMSDTTIEAITGGGLSFVGPFRQEQEVYLPLDGGFVLAQGGKVSLNFRYSDNLDFNRSLITVYWGSTPVYSKKLTREKAGGDTLSFLMPADVIGTHASSLTIAFDLEIEDLYCTKRADQMPWAYVTGDSALYLPTGLASKYSFDLRPYPFETLGRYNNTCVVVPDTMTDAELQTLGQVMALLGTNLNPYGTLSVRRAANFKAADTDANLILLGTYQDNAAIAALNDKLSFGYEAEGTRFAGNAQLVLGESYAADLGVLQIIRSPYFGTRAALIVSGTNDAAVGRIGDFLAVTTNRWKLQDDAVLLDSRGELKTFTFLAAQAPANASLKETVEQNKNAIVYTLVSTLAMLLLVLAILLIVIRARNRKQDE